MAILTLCASSSFGSGFPNLPANGRVRDLKITILSTMLADGAELGEWGFAALVEVDGRKILFDTGAHADVVLKNTRTLPIDLTDAPEVVLSHSHSDHVGGLMALRQAVLDAKVPSALAKVHVGEGTFYSRRSGSLPVETNPMLLIKPQYEESGGVFVNHDQPVQLYPGVWLTGPIPRKYPEKNWSGDDFVKAGDATREDNIPEDMALVFDTEKGLVVLTGCGHAGIVNTIAYARQFIRPERIHALIGGVHLFSASDETLVWTAGKLREVGLDNFMGAHCTGVETVYRWRVELGLDRKHAVVGAVGASFDLAHGISPRHIAK